MDYTDRINRLMNAFKVNQTGLSKLMNVSRGIVSEFASGAREPSKEFMFGLSKLGVSIDWFLTGEGPIFRGGKLETVSNLPEGQKVDSDDPKSATVADLPTEKGPTSGEQIRYSDEFENPSNTPETPINTSSDYDENSGMVRMIPNKNGIPEMITVPMFTPGDMVSSSGKVLAVRDQSLKPEDFIQIPLLAQKVSAGPGQEIVDYNETVGMFPVLKRMLRGLQPRGVYGMEVLGDSMTGERIFGGDIVIFYRELIDDNGIYVLAKDGTLLVKRLTFSITSKKIKIASANERYPEIEEAEDSQCVHILGKVLGWIHVHPY